MMGISQREKYKQSSMATGEENLTEEANYKTTGGERE